MSKTTDKQISIKMRQMGHDPPPKELFSGIPNSLTNQTLIGTVVVHSIVLNLPSSKC